MKFLNKLKMKIRYLIERIRLSESDYLIMKAQSQMYKAMMSTVKCNIDSEYEDVTNKQGDTIMRLEKSRTMTMSVNIVEMLAEGGITFDENAVKLNVTGL